MHKHPRIAVIGAGLSGLACAYELTKAGLDVVVYEKNQDVGGRAGTRGKDRLPFDLGAQFLNNSYAQAKAYCRELGIAGDWRTMALSTHHLLYENQLHCISFHSIREFLNLNFYSHLARLRLMMCYLRLQRDAKGVDLYDLTSSAAAFDNCTARDFVLKWGGEEVLEYAFDSLISAYHFHGAEDLSLCCLLGAVAVIGPDFSYDYTTKGLDEIAQALTRRVKIELGTEVHSVSRGLGGVYVEVDGERYHYDLAVIATTASQARAIYHSPTEAQRGLLDATSYSSTINVGFRVPAVAISHLAMVAVPASQNDTICCYFNQNSKYAGRFDEGETLVNVFARDQKAKELMHASDEQVWQVMQREFLKACPPLQTMSNRMHRYEIQRWPEAIPKYFRGYITRVANFFKQGQGDKGIFLCGDYLNAPWMEGALRGGIQVSESVLATLKSQQIMR